MSDHDPYLGASDLIGEQGIWPEMHIDPAHITLAGGIIPGNIGKESSDNVTLDKEETPILQSSA